MTLRSISGDIKPLKFRVVIVGGSIAGLTLAHALAAYNIDFVVLEAREEIAPNVGASIGFTGNAHRILDQLGVWDELAELATPIINNYAWNDQGHKLGYTEAFKLSQVRHGYPVIFLMRQQALDVLWNRLPEKSRVLVGKKVVKVQQSSTGSTVQCLDGSTYTGDIVVGADGVHSIIHKEMCRSMEMTKPGDMLLSENKRMVTQYRGVFGISNSVTGIREGDMHNVFVKGASILTIGCKDHVFWIVGIKMGRTYYAPEAPRFDQSQLEEELAFLMNKNVCAGVQFKDVYQQTIRCSHLPLEEGIYERWNCGRVACIGDSVHKMTPNLGQGGCCAIESAATLANAIIEIVQSREKQQFPNIEARLDSWATASKPRMRLICTLSEMVIRMQSLDNVVYEFTGPIFSRYYMDTFADLISDMGVGGECISFLPLPKHQSTGTMPFGKRHYIGSPIIPSGRLLWSIPLLICFCLSIIMSPAETPASSPWDVYSAIADLGIFQTIWALESVRICNAITFMSFYHPISLLAHSSVGLWRTVPAYFTFYYLFSASKRLIPDSRCLRLSYAKSIIPALIVGFYVPSLWVSTSPWSSLRFLLIPVTFCLLHRFLAGFIQDTTVEDRIQRPTADLIWIRVSYALTVLISGGISISRHLEAPEPTRSFKSLSLGGALNAQTIGIGSAVIWLILELKDVSQEKKLRLPWLYIAMALPLCLILVGPAATFALGWGLREEILARGYREKVTTDPLASKAHEM